MRYDVLLCDADNTLFDFNKAEENAFAMACETMGFSSTPELLATYSKINEALWKLLEQGRRTCCACGGLNSFWKRFIGRTTRRRCATRSLTRWGGRACRLTAR